MAYITAIINQKGGVGKTTTAHALGAGLIRRGQDVLYVDLDAQQNLTYTLGADPNLPGAYEMLTGRAPIEKTIQIVPQGTVIAASSRLAMDNLLMHAGKEYALKKALAPLGKTYGRMVIDCPPSLGILTINALVAATDVILPVQADIFSLQALGQISQTLEIVKRHTNHNLRIAGILITRYNGRTILSRDLAEMLESTARQLGTKVFAARIRECIALKEAQTSQQDIYTYAPKSNAAADYDNFVTEVLQNGKEAL